MTNMYFDHLEKLRQIKSEDKPSISLFIPLKWCEASAGKIFLALVKAADNLLLKDGYQKLNIQVPNWERWLKQDTVTLAIFHSNGVSHLIPLPTKMQPRVVVADSFHIKPVVSASHEYVDALLLHFNESGASLFRVQPAGESLLETYLPFDIVPKKDWPTYLERQEFREYLQFLRQEIKKFIQPTTKFIAITGTGYPELRSEYFWKQLNLKTHFFDESFKLAIPQNTLSIIRLRLSQIINEIHSQNVTDSIAGRERGEDVGLRYLAPKILKKEIRKLCVSLECMHFGHLEPKTGELKINKTQQNSSDDDLLDDLIELAIDRGIEVSVVPKKFLPKGRSYVAS